MEKRFTAGGTFEVKVTPLAPDEDGEASIGRMKLDKQFHGDLEGSSTGVMLAAGMPASGSAGYVAMERVSGALHGREGAFILQHTGTITRGTPRMTVSVVPGSGTGELEEIAGTLNIIIDGGKHSYEFDYTLPEA